MCLHLFNPPEPSCSPTGKPALGLPQTQCGLCACVPPWWKVVGIGTTDYARLFFPKILKRDAPTFETQLFEPCQWTRPINLQGTVTPQPFVGSMVLQAGSGNLTWTLSLFGLPAIGALPADVAIYQQHAFGFPDRRPFRCLSQNIFDLDPLAGSGNFTGLPQTITIQPFWP